jgi:hypothetical protein
VLSGVDVYTALISRNGRVSGVRGALAGNLVGLGVVGREAVGVRLVVDEQSREVLPCKTSGVLRARADVRSQVGPCPRLRNASLEPYGHGWETQHLTERDLLAGLGSNGLGEEVGDFARVKVSKETPDTRFTPAGNLHVEVDELADSAEWVVIGALRRSSLAKHVAKQSGMASFLDSHEGDVGAVLSSKASVEEILVREDSKAVVEQIKLNPLLVETKSNGLVVKVAVHHVTRQGAVGAETTSGHVRNGHGVLGLAIGVVVGSRWVWWQRGNDSANGSRSLLSSGSGRGTRVRTVAGGTSDIGAPSGRSRASSSGDGLANGQLSSMLHVMNYTYRNLGVRTKDRGRRRSWVKSDGEAGICVGVAGHIWPGSSRSACRKHRSGEEALGQHVEELSVRDVVRGESKVQLQLNIYRHCAPVTASLYAIASTMSMTPRPGVERRLAQHDFMTERMRQ